MYSVTAESSSISVVPKGNRKPVICLGKRTAGGTVVGATGVDGAEYAGPGDQGRPCEGKGGGVCGGGSDGPDGFVGI